jgi:hypothetical protein
MEIEEIWEKLGKPSITLENLKGGIGDDAIKDINKGKISSLKESIKEIESMIVRREKVSKELNEEADKIKMQMENLLLSSDLQDSDSVREQLAFRQKQVEISELQLNEKINCWRDIAQLKKELRENQRELSEKQMRVDMLNKILEK